MAMDAGEIERLIKARIPDARVTIRDLAGDGDHYAATVISASFKGKSRVQQHQLVYEALKTQMGGVLHALALQTAPPERLIPAINRRQRPRKTKVFAPLGLAAESALHISAMRAAGAARRENNPWASSNSSTMK